MNSIYRCDSASPIACFSSRAEAFLQVQSQRASMGCCWAFCNFSSLRARRREFPSFAFPHSR